MDTSSLTNKQGKISTVGFKTGRETKIKTRRGKRRRYYAEAEGNSIEASNKMHAVMRLIYFLARKEEPIEVEFEDLDNDQIKATQVGFPDETYGVGVSDGAARRKLLIRLFCEQNLIMVDGIPMEQFRDDRMSNKPRIRSQINKLALADVNI